MNYYLHFRTCFAPFVSVYLPRRKSGWNLLAIHQDEDGFLWDEGASGVAWPRRCKSKSALTEARNYWKKNFSQEAAR